MEEYANYIGVKMIKAVQMTAQKAALHLERPIYTKNAEVDAKGGIPGYLVKYPDGYVSWSPKAQFEAAYFKLSDPTRINQADVMEFMGEPEVRRLDGKTTLVSVETLTGFVQHEASSCVDPANYDEETGKTVAIGRIQDKIWPCLGFVLQWARNGLRR